MIRRTGIIATEFVAGIMIVAALLMWRLSAGPINLSFLTPYIEAALSSPDGTVVTKIGSTELVWASWEHAIDLRARDVRALASDGKPVASVPALAVRLSVSALLHGVVAPTRIDMLGPRLRLMRQADGSFDLGLGEEANLEGGDAVGRGIIGALLAPPGAQSPAGLLNRVQIINGEFLLDDRASGLTWRAPSLDLDLGRDQEGISAWLKGELDIGGQLVPIQGGGRFRRATGEAEASLSFRGMEPEFLAERLAVLEPLRRIKLPIDGSASISLDASQHLHSARLDLTGGRGTLMLPELYPIDVPIESAGLGLGYDGATRSLKLERLELDLGGPKLKASGRLTAMDGPGLVEADVSIEEMPTNELRDWWPERIGANARQWVIANLSAGTVHEAHARVIGQLSNLDPASFQLSSISGAMNFEGLAARYLASLPAVAGVDGTATFSNNRFDLALSSGVLRGLRLGPSAVAITGLSEPDQLAAIEVVIQGPLKDALEVLDQKPLGYPSKLGLDITQVQGRTAIRLVFRFPLIKRLTLEQVAIAAAANLRDVVIPKVVKDWRLSDGTLALSLDGLGMDVKGDARLAGTPVTLDWRENFANTARLRRRIDVKGRIDDAGRAALGFDLASYLKGAVAADVHLAQPSGDATRIEIALDLAGASVSVPELGWQEPALAEGRAAFTVRLEGDRLTRIEPISIKAGAIEADGRIAFGPDGGVELVGIERLKRGETDLAATVKRQREGEFAVTLEGASLDLEPIFEAKAKNPDKAGPRLQVALKVGRLQLSAKRRLAAVSAALTSDGKVWRSITAEGTAGASGRLKLAMSAQEHGHSFQLTSPDAGAVLTGLGVLDNLSGGTLSVDGTADIDADGLPLQAKFDIRDAVINRAPILARVAALASLTGILDSLSGQGIGFPRISGGVSQDAQTITLGDFGAYGAALGLTGKGRIKRATDAVHFEGTLVPAYGLNQILSAIPLIGAIITGGKNEGVLAVDFIVDGTLEEPEVKVNPLTAFAPGFLRDFVRLFGPLEGVASDIQRSERQPR